MKILVAPDSFKGSLTASRFCEISRQAILEIAPSTEVDLCPMADGGEGTTLAVVTGWGGRLMTKPVRGPLGEAVPGVVGFSPDGKAAVLEMASASGLTLVPRERRTPLLATSYGTGELLALALDAGVERLILGLGGTATNDGGSGLLEALGFRLLDREGRPILRGARGLVHLERIDRSSAHPRLTGPEAPEILVACDVTNPLLGADGASAVYGPQKGATPETLTELERGLAHLADVVEAQGGRRYRDLPGAGAAGGAGFALMGVLGARLVSGFDLVAEQTGLAARLRPGRYDWVLTGEGRLDAQTRHGKLLTRLGRLAASVGTPTIALVGAIEGSPKAWAIPGLDHVFPITEGPCTLEEAMSQTERLLHAAVQRVLKLVLGASRARPGG